MHGETLVVQEETERERELVTPESEIVTTSAWKGS